MHLEVVQGAVYVPLDPHVPHVQGQAHGEVQEDHELRHIKLISINRRLFWMHLELHNVFQGAFVQHDYHAPHVCHTVIQSYSHIYSHTGFVQQSY
jgi:hypothetical protein